MLKKSSLLALVATSWLCLFAVPPLAAHDPISTKLTFTREISRILVARCGSCHHDDGPAPMPLIRYSDVRPWAKAIKEEVLERRMPPGQAVPGFGPLAATGALSQEELHLIADWVEGGAPAGDPVYLPEIPYLWETKPEPPPGNRRPVRAGEVLGASLLVGAVEPAPVAEGGSMKLAAQLPDGRVEPLVWVYQWRARWNRPYRFTHLLRLPAGTRILITPPEAEAVLLSPVTARQSRRR